MKSQFPGSNLYSDWLLGPSGVYRLVGAAYVGSLFPSLAGCEDVAPQEAVSVVGIVYRAHPRRGGVWSTLRNRPFVLT